MDEQNNKDSCEHDQSTLDEMRCLCPEAALVGLPYHPLCPIHNLELKRNAE